MTRPSRVTLTVFAVASLLVLGARAAHADTTVQVPMGTLLDKRSVTVLQGTTVVVFNLTIDGGGTDTGDGNLQNGFATKAVAMLKSPGNVANALPDDGHFPADTTSQHPHPEIVLHYSNDADPTSGQNHMVNPVGGTFSFPMPAATYSKVFLFFHGADGGTTVTLTLTYSDATTQVQTSVIPDFFNDPTDPKVFNLVTNLAKWSKTTTIAEAGGHHIFGVELDPMAGKTLMSIQVARKPPPGYLVFWGATGVATSAVADLPDAGTDASAPAGDAGADASGAGGASATAGASGAAGVSGAAGTSGGAGGDTTTGAAGTTTSGSAGATGSAGSSGAAGTTTTGTAGATGAAGKPAGKSGGGCEIGAAGDISPRALWLTLAAALAVGLGHRRRRLSPQRRRA